MIQENLLAGTTVRLTSLRMEDAASILKWRDDTRFTRLWNSDPLFVRSETQIKEGIVALGKTERELGFAIRLLDHERIVGTVGLDEIEWPNRVASLSIAIGCPDDWGKGYGTEAVKLLIRYAFNELNLFRLQLTVFAFNVRAIALYEKMRFKKEGTFRQFMERDGERHDMHLYGLLEQNGKISRGGRMIGWRRPGAQRHFSATAIPYWRILIVRCQGPIHGDPGFAATDGGKA